MHLAVDRTDDESFAVGRGLFEMDVQAMERMGLKAGDLVNLASRRRPQMWARLAEPREHDRGRGMVRLDRYLRQGLHSRLNEPLEVTPVSHRVAECVQLLPAIDLTQTPDLAQHIKNLLSTWQTPIAEGSVLYVPFPDSRAGVALTAMRVVGGPGVIDETTTIEIQARGDRVVGREVEVTFEDVGGLDTEIRLIRELVQLPLQMPQMYWRMGLKPPRGVLLYGPPGVGKTHLVRAVANEIQAGVYYVNGPEIVGSMHGQTEANLRDIFQEAARTAPSIVLIDEIDAVAPKRSRVGSQSDVRMVTQLLSLMDGLANLERIVVIGTTNRIDALEPAIRRPGRFDREVYIAPPGEEARLDVLRIHTREMPLTDAAREALPSIAARTYGYVGADLMELAREAGLQALRRTIHDAPGGAAFEFSQGTPEVVPEDFSAAMLKIRPSALRESFVVKPATRWSDLAGLEGIKRRLELIIDYRSHTRGRPDRLDIEVPTGVLLHGPPGTGKSSLVHALANECGWNLMVVNGAEIFTKWLGESEEGIRHIFRVARQIAPCIVLLDPLESIAGLPSVDEVNRTPERVLSQVLTELDGISAIDDLLVVGATHRLAAVSPVILESGRLGSLIHVPLPDEADRREVLDLYLPAVSFDGGPGQEAIERLVEATVGLSGAEIKGLANDLKLTAWARGRQDDVTGDVPIRIAQADVEATLAQLSGRG